MWYEALWYEALKISLGVFIILLHKESLNGSIILAENGHWWYPIISFLSFIWGIWLIVYTILRLCFHQ